MAASTDISKVVRLEYGSDETYMALAEAAREGWLEWNARAIADGEAPLYHETGVLMVSRRPMAPGGFEHDSYHALLRRGHRPTRVDARAVASRFPAWRRAGIVDGFHHEKGGYAESGRAIECLVGWVRAHGVEVRENVRLVGWLGGDVVGSSAPGPVRGARIESESASETCEADAVVLATGAWTGASLPALVRAIRPSGHPVFHLVPREPALFAPERFPVFTADIARTGYYGFPMGRAGVVKIGNHGVGTEIPASADRHVSPDATHRLREFLIRTFPDLSDAEVVYTRLCLYADTQDEDLWIAADPERPGLVVAGGGSGHGFKFAPVLGALTADAVEGVQNAALARFAWRPDLRLDRGNEAARCHDD